MKKFIKIVFTLIALLSLTLAFTTNVKALTEEDMVQIDAELATVPSRIIISFPVAVQSPYNNELIWTSSNEEVLEFMDGWFVVKRPTDADAEVTVTLKVVRPNDEEISYTRDFQVLVPKGVTNAPTYAIHYENVSLEEVDGLKSQYKLGEATFELEEPEATDGKVFLGWYANEELTQEVTRVKVGSQGELTFYAKWDVPATYTVKHLGEPLGEGDYVVLREETLDSFVGHTVYAVEDEFTGFDFNPTHPDAVDEGEVEADGSLVLELYYSRKEYTVTFDTKGGSPVEPITAKYEEEVPAPTAPTKVGYAFEGWDVVFPLEVTEDITVTASWIAQAVNYTIKYYGEDLQGNFVEMDSVTDTAVADLPLYLENDIEFEGFTYLLGHVDEVNDLVIAADGSSVFEFYYSRNSYDVAYVLGGGSWSLDTVITYMFGEEVTAPTETPLREGYTFTDWDTEFPFEMPAEDVVVTAEWTELPTYIVTFNSQGGSAVQAQQVIEGELATRPEDPTKAGYTFENWYTAAAGGEVFDFDTSITSSITLYARWTANLVQIKVEHYQQNILDDEYTFTEETFVPAFVGSEEWVYPQSYDGFTVTESTILVQVPAEGEAVAKFYYTRNIYTITVYGNGAVQDDVEITAKYQAPVEAPVLTRLGYDFAGWNKEFPATMPLNGLEITAQWEVEVYTIYYSVSGVEIELGENPNPDYYTIEDEIILEALPILDEDGLFIGWFTDEEMTELITEISLGSTGDIYLYCMIRYTDARSVELERERLETLYVDFNDEDFLDQYQYEITGEYGTTIQWQSDSTAYVVDIEGYVYITDPLEDQTITLLAIITMGDYVDYLYFDFNFDADYILYAQFIVDQEVSGEYEVLSGENIHEPYVTPTKDGYEFLHWSTEEDGAEEYDFDTLVFTDLVLYAVFAKIHTVNFMDGTEELHTLTVRDQSQVEEPEEDPSKDGYVFLHWSTEVDGEAYDFDTPVTADLELFAVWEEETSEETFAEDLFISEYIEGSSSNKAIEIFNGTGSNVDLSAYKLSLYSNGAITPSSTMTLSGILAHGEVFVMYHGSANANIKAVGDISNSTVINHNGNDPIALFNGETMIDIVGVWGSSDDWGKDTTLVRKPTVIQGNTTYAADEWDTYPSDTTTYLGTHECNLTVVELTPQEKIAAAIAEIELENNQEVTSNLELPTSGAHGVAITWASNHAAIDPDTGTVTRPAAGDYDVTVTLTATFSIVGVTEEVTYTVIVKAEEETGGESSTLDVNFVGTTGNPVTGWVYSVGSAYNDNSLKLDASGKYVLSPEVTIAGPTNFEVHLKGNGSPATGIVSVLGLDSNGTVVETVNNPFSISNAVFDFTGQLTNTTIKKIKIVYTTKTSGNLGLYTFKLGN